MYNNECFVINYTTCSLQNKQCKERFDILGLFTNSVLVSADNLDVLRFVPTFPLL